jgi:hypothetical protein
VRVGSFAQDGFAVILARGGPIHESCEVASRGVRHPGAAAEVLNEAPHFLGWSDIKRGIGPRARNLALPDNCSIDEASRERGLSADQGGEDSTACR